MIVFMAFSKISRKLESCFIGAVNKTFFKHLRNYEAIKENKTKAVQKQVLFLITTEAAESR
jgi:hypothetical protein